MIFAPYHLFSKLTFDTMYMYFILHRKVPLDEKFRSNRFSWYGHVMRGDKENVATKVLDMGVAGKGTREEKEQRKGG